MEYYVALKNMENLQHLMTNYRYIFSEELITANGIAILAIEKQIPKHTLVFNGEHLCPSCHNPIEKTPYCSNCGQRLTSE